MIESWYSNLVSDVMCERRNKLNISLRIKRIQVFGPKFEGSVFFVWPVPGGGGACVATAQSIPTGVPRLEENSPP